MNYSLLCCQLLVSTDVVIPFDELDYNSTSDVAIDLSHIISGHGYGSQPRDDEDLK